MPAPQSSSICLNKEPVTFVDRGVSCPTTTVLSLSPRLGIRLQCSEIPEGVLKELLRVRLQGLGLSVELATGQRLEVYPVEISTGDRVASLIPTRGPITALQTSERLQVASFSILNFPDFLDRTVRPMVFESAEEGSWEMLGDVQLEAPPWRVRITSIPGREGVKAALGSHGYALTHEGAAARLDGHSFSIAEGIELLECLQSFLSFVRGSRSGLAVVTGLDETGERVWERWGAGGVEDWRTTESWFHPQHGEVLAALFPGYWKKLRSTTSSDPIPMAIEWYLLGNAQGNAPASIILTHAAIERLTHEVVGPNSRRQKEGDRVASALRALSIDPRVPTAFNQAGVWQPSRWLHAPHAFVSIRNDLVHPGMVSGVLTIDEYFQASQLGLWYVELMLLHTFDYQGSYWNRIAQEFEPVPWAKVAT